jgi:hypothetical protein
MLDERNCFRVIPQTRNDYVAFFWKDETSSERVLVELFMGGFLVHHFAFKVSFE